MKDWQQRVVDEKDALDEKLSKLNNFLREGYYTSETSLDLLFTQARIMEAYSFILAARIKRFKDD